MKNKNSSSEQIFDWNGKIGAFTIVSIDSFIIGDTTSSKCYQYEISPLNSIDTLLLISPSERCFPFISNNKLKLEKINLGNKYSFQIYFHTNHSKFFKCCSELNLRGRETFFYLDGKQLYESESIRDKYYLKL